MIENIQTSTNVQIVTNIMKNIGFKMNGKNQSIYNIGTIYPQDYFSPYDYINLIDKRSNNTYTMHHFYKSWLSPKERVKSNIKKVLAKTIGGKNIARVRKLLSKA